MRFKKKYHGDREWGENGTWANIVEVKEQSQHGGLDGSSLRILNSPKIFSGALKITKL